MQKSLNKYFSNPFESIKKIAVLSLAVLTLTASLLLPTTALAQVAPLPTDGTTTSPNVVIMPSDKIACKLYAQMIKNLMTQIRLRMDEKTKIFETKIATLYTQAEAAFLAGDIDAYDAIMVQISALEVMYNQAAAAFNQVLTVLNQAYLESIKNPCKIQLVKDLVKKALGIYKEAKMLCDKLTAALALIQ